MHELVSDLVKKAQEIDALIEALPGIKSTEDDQVKFLESSPHNSNRSILTESRTIDSDVTTIGRRK